MWIIIVNKNLQEYRDHKLLEILNDEKPKESYLYYKFNRYNYNSFLPDAKIYKTKSGAEKLLYEIKKEDKTSWRSKFYNLNDKELSIRKLSREEWHQIVNFELTKLEMNYLSKKSKLEKKKSQFPLS